MYPQLPSEKKEQLAGSTQINEIEDRATDTSTEAICTKISSCNLGRFFFECLSDSLYTVYISFLPYHNFLCLVFLWKNLLQLSILSSKRNCVLQKWTPSSWWSLANTWLFSHEHTQTGWYKTGMDTIIMMESCKYLIVLTWTYTDRLIQNWNGHHHHDGVLQIPDCSHMNIHRQADTKLAINAPSMIIKIHVANSYEDKMVCCMIIIYTFFTTTFETTFMCQGATQTNWKIPSSPWWQMAGTTGTLPLCNTPSVEHLKTITAKLL